MSEAEGGNPGQDGDGRALDRAVFRGFLLFSATALAIWAFGLILVPFLVPIAWAMCLGAITAPFYRPLSARLRRPKLTALLMVLLVALVILVPIMLTGLLVIEEAAEVDFGPLIAAANEHFPTALEALNDIIQTLGLPEIPADRDPVEYFSSLAKENLGDLARSLFAGPIGKGALSLMTLPLDFLIVLVTLYFVYCESGRLRRLVVDISPLDPHETDLILETLRGTTAAAILGGVVVALVQGLLGGVMFAIAGVPSPVLWGVLMAGFSLLPFGGTAIIWAPASIYMILTGDVGWGIFIIAFGGLIVGSVDNVMRPWLLSKSGAADIHPMMLFFAILSGIGIFGISGIVFGPLLLALLTTMLRIYRWHFTPSRGGADSEEAALQELEEMG